MEPDPAPQAQTRAEALPSQLAAQLTPRTRDALGHPLRRQILRTLNGAADSHSPGEIAAMVLPGASVDVINYHARVLEHCGSIAISGTRQDRGDVTRRYASRVADDKQIAAVLQATRGIDRWTADPQ